MQPKKLLNRKRTALLLGVFLLLSVPLFSQKEDLKVRITVRRANIRVGPDLKSEIISVVKRGRILQCDGKEGKWYRVRLPIKVAGYALRGYIHQSIVEEVGKEVTTIETDVIKRDDSAPPHKYEAGAGLGFVFPADKDYDGRIKFCGYFYYKLSKQLALELRMQTFQINKPDDPQGLTEGKLSVFPFHVSVQGRFPLKSKFIPYVIGGIGYYLNYFSSTGIKIPERVDKVKNAVGFHFGGGIDYFLINNISINVDVRYCIAEASGVMGYMGEELGEVESINLNSFMFETGIKIIF